MSSAHVPWDEPLQNPSRISTRHPYSSRGRHLRESRPRAHRLDHASSDAWRHSHDSGILCGVGVDGRWRIKYISGRLLHEHPAKEHAANIGPVRRRKPRRAELCYDAIDALNRQPTRDRGSQ